MIPDVARDRTWMKSEGIRDPGPDPRGGRRDMKRWLIAMTTFALVTAACTAGGGSSDAPSAIDTGSGTSHAPVTLHDLGRLDRSRAPAVQPDLQRFHGEVPLDHGQQRGWRERPEDHRLDQRGNPPDAVLSFTLDSVGQFCASGAWQDLNPYIEQSGFDVSQFPPSVEAYTSFAGAAARSRSSRTPTGLYYNTDMFKKAGIADAPEDAHRARGRREEAHGLQLRRIDQGRRLRPVVRPLRVQHAATWGTSSARSGTTTTARRSVVDTDPAWKAMFQWQHDFIANVYGGGDFQTGSDQLQRFVAGCGRRVLDAHRTSQTGRVAMNFDGEWRTAFIADEAPDLQYATAPFRCPTIRWTTYGRGPVGGTIIGIPKGSPHPDEAWLLVDYMATDTADAGVHGQQRPERADDARLAQLAGPGCDPAVPDVPGHLREPRTPTTRSRRPSARRIRTSWGVRRELAGREGNGPRRWPHERREADQRSTRASGDLARGTCDEHDRISRDRGSPPGPTPSCVGPGSATSSAA